MSFDSMKQTVSEFCHKNVLTFCVSCFLLFSLVTFGIQYRTESIYRHRLILNSMGLLKPHRIYLGWMIQSRYKQVHEFWMDGQTGELFRNRTRGRYPLFVVGKSSKTIKCYAFPFSFDGAYGPIEGMIGVAKDGATLTGFKITRQNELGLGSKCEWAWFSHQFKGKRFANREGKFVSMGVVQGKVEDKVPISDVDENVQGISGALLTNNRIEEGLRLTFKCYEPFSKKLRREHYSHVDARGY